MYLKARSKGKSSKLEGLFKPFFLLKMTTTPFTENDFTSNRVL